MDRVIIIGTGVFGLSTVDHIHQRWPKTQLSIISRPSRLAPSDDISKIVRVDYSNPERMTEAIEAQKQWNSNSFSKFQSSIGRIVIYEQNDRATLQKINEAREELGLQRRQPGDGTLMRDAFGTMAPESLTYVLASDDRIVDWETCMSDARERRKKPAQRAAGPSTKVELQPSSRTELVSRHSYSRTGRGSRQEARRSSWPSVHGLPRFLPHPALLSHRTEGPPWRPGCSRTLSS
jgi:hypothetical protein